MDSQTRIYVNVFNKGTVSLFGTVLLFLFLLPYVITSLFGNINHPDINSMVNIMSSSDRIYIENVTEIGRERIPLDIYLLDKLARTINADYHIETLKAQAVLLRTALIEELWQSSGSIHGIVETHDPDYSRGVINENVIIAVTSTQGIILTYEDKVAKVAYFAVSNGRTRDGSEAFGQEDLPYFKAVDCPRDFLAENFTSQKTMGKNEFLSALYHATGITLSNDFTINDIKIKRDLSNYIMDLTINNGLETISLSGEESRFIWGLSSSCFSIDEIKNRIVFSVRGVGHGFGMSQFGANEMAKNDHDYVSILEYFFSGAKLAKF